MSGDKDTPRTALVPSKYRIPVKQQNLVRFEDMGELLTSIYLYFPSLMCDPR